MAAPKHELAVRHAGRPLAIETVEELDAKIDEYFKACDERRHSIYNEKLGVVVKVKLPEPYTMSGLARYLDVDRRTIVNYSHSEKFFPTIAAARARVEQDMEVRLLESRTPQGAIFGLKNNFAWVDESSLNANVNSTTDLSPEAKAILAKASRSDNGVTGS